MTLLASPPVVAEEPLVTVIVCVHNAGDYLRPCVESLLAQTHRNLEILVVDDGSDDGCIETLGDLRDERIRVLRQEHLGKSSALNRAIREGRGDFLAIQDADDLSQPLRIARQLACMQENQDVAAVFCGHDLLLGGRHVAPRLRSRDREACHLAITRMTLPALDPTAMYRRSMVERYEYDAALEIAQGLDYILRIGEEHPMLVLGECLYSYRFTTTSATKRHADRKLQFVHEVCERACVRRGLPREKAVDFYQDARTLGRNRVLDNNLPAHFMESCLDLRFSGHRLQALRTGLKCALLRPLDRHYHKALLYSVMPASMIRRVRRSLIHARLAPIPPRNIPRAEQPAEEPPRARRLRTSRPLRICLFGAAGDTGNLGVSALMYSALGGIARLADGAQVTVFDNGWGERPAQARLSGGDFDYRLSGARLSRRFHRPESYWNMRMSMRLGGVANPGARALLAADAVWDVSGGDSFADLYGPRHLRLITEPKLLALERGVPLILLPQTYGPFTSVETRLQAAGILRQSVLAWARDERSFAALQELLGPDFDADRHRCGVDMAFALEPQAPAPEGIEPVAAWLDEAGQTPLIGLNVSGLLYNDPDAARKYGLSVDYPSTMLRTVRQFLRETDARILLVPHVVVSPKRIEADQHACQRLLERLSPAERERVRALPGGLDTAETKWVLSRLDWFSGARMHATIGALSTHVPTCGMAYSRKMRGVFDTCGQGEHVADLRKSSEEDVLATLWRSWGQRGAAREILRDRIPGILARADAQMARTLQVTARSLRSELF